MDTDVANRIITEITNRLGVGYSVFSDAVSQYAQAKATESLVFSVVFLGASLLIIAIFFLRDIPQSLYRYSQQSICWLFVRGTSAGCYYPWHFMSYRLYQLVKRTTRYVPTRNY